MSIEFSIASWYLYMEIAGGELVILAFLVMVYSAIRAGIGVLRH